MPPLGLVLFGTQKGVCRKCKGAGRRWVEHHRENGRFPPLLEHDAEVGALVLCDPSSDLNPEERNWRLFGLIDLWTAVVSSAPTEDEQWLMRARLDDHLSSISYAALELLTQGVAPHNRDATIRRYRTILRCWHDLDLFRYRYSSLEEMDLGSVLMRCSSHLIDFVGAPAGGDPREVIGHAIETLQAMSGDARRDAIAFAAMKAAASSEREQVRRLADPQRMRDGLRWLESKNPLRFVEASAGHPTAIAVALALMARSTTLD